MIIGGRKVNQIVITRLNEVSRIVEAESKQEVIAVISDDNEMIIKDGYDVVIDFHDGQEIKK